MASARVVGGHSFYDNTIGECLGRVLAGQRRHGKARSHELLEDEFAKVTST